MARDTVGAVHPAPLAITLYADHSQRQFAYDVLILVIVVVNIGLGMRQGLIRRAIGLAAIFGGAAAATWVGNAVVRVLSHDGLSANAWGFVGVFALVIAMMEVLSTLYSDQIERVASLAFDRTAGAIMGLVTGVMMVSVLVLVVLAVGDAHPSPGRDVAADHTTMANEIRSSTLGGLFAQADGGLRTLFTPVLPGDLPDHLAAGSPT
jgi:hypothetical protein